MINTSKPTMNSCDLMILSLARDCNIEFFKRLPLEPDTFDYCDLFGEASVHHQLKFMEWMISEGLVTTESALTEWTIEGYLKYIQGFMVCRPDYDIHFDQDKIFRSSCKSNNLEIAKWLLATYPETNIRAENDDAFITCCQQFSDPEEIEICKWLESLCDDYVLVIDGCKIVKYDVSHSKNQGAIDKELPLADVLRAKKEQLYNLQIEVATMELAMLYN